MLKEIRKKRNMSQGQLSELSNVPKRTIEFYEQGIRKIDGANINYLTSLSIALNCKIEDIVENENVKEKLKNIYGKE